MKRIFASLCLALLLFTLLLPVAAHPGRTDQYGGHWNHSTGEYHYHGVPDSNHSGGSGSSSSSSSQIPPSRTPTKSNDWILPVVILSVLALPFLLGFIVLPLVDKIKSVFASPPDEQGPTPSVSTTYTQPSTQSPSPKPTPSTPKQAVQESSEAAKPQTPSTRPLPLKGSENRFVRHTDLLESTPPATPSRPNPPSQPKSHISKTTGAPSWLLDIDPRYFTEPQQAQFASTLDKERAKRATTEPLVLKNLHIDTARMPYRVTCTVVSHKSYQEYQASHISCTCKDYLTRHVPCKHIIALALKVDAISIDQAEVKDLI